MIFNDPDDSLWCWETILKDTLSFHIKTRKVKVRRENQPWMNGAIRKSLNERYKLFTKAKTTCKNSPEWKCYKKKRNFCTKLIRDAKVNFWKNKFSNTNNSKSFWKTVKEFNGGKKTSKIEPLLDNNKIITDDSEKANKMNSFFAKIGEKLPEGSTTTNDNSNIYRITPTLSELKPDITQFQKAFSSAIKNNKSSGPDNISSRDLKLHEAATSQSLFKVFQKKCCTGFISFQLENC